MLVIYMLSIHKYLKYKLKYLQAKKIIGGDSSNAINYLSKSEEIFNIEDFNIKSRRTTYFIILSKKNNFKFIQLRDASMIDLEGGCNISIPLSTLYILVTGISWYNSKGYFSKNHELNFEHNFIVQHMSIANLVSEINIKLDEECTIELSQNSIDGLQQQLDETKSDLEIIKQNLNSNPKKILFIKNLIQKLKWQTEDNVKTLEQIRNRYNEFKIMNNSYGTLFGTRFV